MLSSKHYRCQARGFNVPDPANTGSATFCPDRSFARDPNTFEEPKNLNHLFHDSLKDIYFAEKKILAALPKMAKATNSRASTS
jgi:hypothetical protein